MSEMMTTPGIGAQPAQTAPEGQLPNATQAPAAAPEDLKFAAKFNALTKKERALVEKQQAIKSQEEALARYESARKGAKLNPMAALAELGLSYEEVTKFLLNGGKPTPELEEKSASDQVRELRERIEAEKKEAEAKEAQRGLDTFKANLSHFVQTNAEKYELIHTMGAGDRVLSEIEKAWIETGGNDGGVVASFDEACDFVEAQLEKEQLQKIMGTKKAQSLFQKQAQSAPAAGDNAQSFLRSSESPLGPTHATQTRPTTLAASAHSARQHPQADRRQSEAELHEEAKRLLRWLPKS